MLPSRYRLTLIDLMAAVGAAALALGWIVWAAPGRAAPALISIGPLAGILWDRWRGGTGIPGGALGGAAYAGFVLVWKLTRHEPSVIASGSVPLVFSIAGCSLFGTLMGVAAWLVAAIMGRSVAPTLPRPGDRFVRQR
jgi:hypothetical protein